MLTPSNAPFPPPVSQDLAKLLDHMPTMIGYWDKECRNRFGNDAYRLWFGIDPSTMPGKHIREVIGEERYRLNLPYIEGALAGQQQTFERSIPLPDGQIRYTLAHYMPDIVHGVVQGFYVLVTDITALKKTEAALKASEERYRAVVEDQTEVICRVRPDDGSLLFVNEVFCRTFGKSADDLLRGTWMPVVFPDDLPLVRQRLQELTPTTPVVVVENRVYGANGELLWMQFVNRALFDEHGKLQEIQAVGRDITERKQAQLALEAAQAELEQRVQQRTEQLRQVYMQLTQSEERERQAIARFLHDDLGQVLHVVKLKLGLLPRLPEQTALLKELETLVAEASYQVRSLTSQLSPPVLRSLGLGPALRWLKDEMAEHYRLEVACTVTAEPLPLTPAQSTTLFRAARELLLNVVKHAASSRAELSLQRSAERVYLTVADHGRGLSDPDAAGSGRQGFGLTSIRERIDFLGGSTRIDSAVGQGVRVTLTIPLSPPLEGAP